MMTNIDIALLTREYDHDGECGNCGVGYLQPHGPACVMDLALSERGWNTRAERDAALARINLVSQPTLPPPPKEPR